MADADRREPARPRESIDVEPHQLEVADLAVGPLEPGPQMLPVGTIEAPAPLGAVVAGDRSGEALRDHRTPPAQVGRRFWLVDARRSVGPFEDPPLGGHAKPADDQRAVLEDHQVDETLMINWPAARAGQVVSPSKSSIVRH